MRDVATMDSLTSDEQEELRRQRRGSLAALQRSQGPLGLELVVVLPTFLAHDQSLLVGLIRA